jgi:hypothetical protein
MEYTQLPKLFERHKVQICRLPGGNEWDDVYAMVSVGAPDIINQKGKGLETRLETIDQAPERVKTKNHCKTNRFRTRVFWKLSRT